MIDNKIITATECIKSMTNKRPSKLTEESIKKNLAMGRTETSKFKKGQSGNTKGRPKAKPLPPIDAAQFKGDPKKALIYLLNHATNEADVYKYSRALIDYCEPKLSSIQSEIKQEKTITIKIEGYNTKEIKHVNCKTIEGEIVKEDVLTKDSLKKLKESKLEEIKKV